MTPSRTVDGYHALSRRHQARDNATHAVGRCHSQRQRDGTLWRQAGNGLTETTRPRPWPSSVGCQKRRDDPRLMCAYACAPEFAGDDKRAADGYEQ